MELPFFLLFKCFWEAYGERDHGVMRFPEQQPLDRKAAFMLQTTLMDSHDCHELVATRVTC